MRRARRFFSVKRVMLLVLLAVASAAFLPTSVCEASAGTAGYTHGRLASTGCRIRKMSNGRIYYFAPNGRRVTRPGWYNVTTAFKVCVGEKGYVTMKFDTYTGKPYTYNYAKKRWECIQKLTIVNSIMTENPCYTEGTGMKVKGLMLHSTGDGQSRAMTYFKTWNSPSYNRACVHAFIDAVNGKVYQTLPWDYRGWHCAKSGNDTHIGVEMCEPDCITYVSNTTFICTDMDRAREQATRTYNSAVALFAGLCIKYDLDPLEDGVIVSHYEGGIQGIASGHVDPEHLWTGLGLPYTMDTFRHAVALKVYKMKWLDGKLGTVSKIEKINVNSNETEKEGEAMENIEKLR